MQSNLTEQQQAARSEYDEQKERRAALTTSTLMVTENSRPIPTQEENDLLRLGLMHPDEISQPASPKMPALEVQRAYLAAGEGSVEPIKEEPAPPPARHVPPPAARPQPEQRPADRNVPRTPDSDKR
jgi:hypothetical protein